MRFILLNYFGDCNVVVEQSDCIVLLWSSIIYDFVMKPYSWHNQLFVKKRLTKTLISVMLIFPREGNKIIHATMMKNKYPSFEQLILLYVRCLPEIPLQYNAM